jgi:hypothetical protein
LAGVSPNLPPLVGAVFPSGARNRSAVRRGAVQFSSAQFSAANLLTCHRRMVEMAGGSSTAHARASRAPLGMTGGWRIHQKKSHKSKFRQFTAGVIRGAANLLTCHRRMVEMAGGPSTAHARASRAPLGMTGKGGGIRLCSARNDGKVRTYQKKSFKSLKSLKSKFRQGAIFSTERYIPAGCGSPEIHLRKYNS